MSKTDEQRLKAFQVAVANGATVYVHPVTADKMKAALNVGAGQTIPGYPGVRFIESELQRWPRRTWITFVDLNGSRVRVRSRLILQITQCSVEQRAVDRAFIRGLRQEEQDEEAWEE